VAINFVGQECPTHTDNADFCIFVGQECPTHTDNGDFCIASHVSDAPCCTQPYIVNTGRQ